MKISTTDPEAALSSKRGASEFAFYDNYLIDNRSCIIAGVMASPARLSQEIIAARRMLERAKERFGLQPASVSADKSYGAGEFLSVFPEPASSTTGRPVPPQSSLRGVFDGVTF